MDHVGTSRLGGMEGTYVLGEYQDESEFFEYRALSYHLEREYMVESCAIPRQTPSQSTVGGALTLGTTHITDPHTLHTTNSY